VPTALPGFLVEAEQAADRRYRELGRTLHLPWHVAAHALASSVCAQLSGTYRAAMPGRPDQYHDEARDRIEALHFALRVQPRPRRPVVGEFDASLAARHLDEHALSAIGKMLDEMADYVRIRDALIACWSGMFTGRLLKPATIRFDLLTFS